jgi:hypothetical protein
MSQEEQFSREISEHNCIVHMIEKILQQDFGLIKHCKTRPFTSGFIPDIVTNIDGTNNGWIIVDVINSQESLVRDVGGLLVSAANAEDATYGICAVIALASSKVTDEKPVMKLVSQISNFHLILDKPKANFFVMFRITIRELLRDALRDRLNGLNEWWTAGTFDWLIQKEHDEKLRAGLQMLEAKH